ncbi:ADP-ribosylation factor GTPase-activating protein AGD3 [Trifolium repens]|nr:ADP-ribosylation factor GTPase-activating protein AGD3 [Trifolium repens]
MQDLLQIFGLVYARFLGILDQFMEDLWDWLIRILRLIYAGFSGLVYAGLDLCSVIKRKVQAALNERMQEYKRQIDRESQGLRGFFVLDSRGMLHYYRRQCRKLSVSLM